jgi:hypothetical protein
MRFCSNCGTQLPASPPPPPPPQGGYAPQPGYAPPPQQQYAPPPQGYYPPQGQYPAPAPPPRRRNNCGCCLLALLVVVGLPVIGGTIIYFMIQNGSLNQRQVLIWAGQGPGEASIMNLSDSTLEVTVAALGEEDSGFGTETMTLEPRDTDSFPDLSQGRYRLSFSSAGGAPPDAECSIKIDSGDFYQFVAVPEGLAVSREKEPARTAGDANVETSPLCRR